MRFMLNWLLTSIAIAIATFLVPGIQPFGMADAWVCFAFVGLFLNIVDSLVKPFLTVISLPLTIITLGIFQLVVNSFMLELASYLSVTAAPEERRAQRPAFPSGRAVCRMGGRHGRAGMLRTVPGRRVKEHTHAKKSTQL